MQQVRNLVAYAESGGFLLLIGFDAEAQGIIWEDSKTLSSLFSPPKIENQCQRTPKSDFARYWNGLL